ncbi:N-methyl-L-tryptophan oxidase [Paenibacillus eucommiae]|uniref:N-methyl-L-tryptophan oxidase n=1 Tax=Paenibacillus eucommiae TaxID=1355755 RepID=A0ABS4IX94_9BACL|nr:N-methyl-L-tryptophan oxidase [Paenibacillus eucommiae]MBP1992211.1 N-methyl-L-tryptophan oxidase [Paenibacillus eucommiae]
MIHKSYDVIIAGAGSMGMSAGYHLAKQGVRTLMIDAFDPPHQEGSHHGEPRLIRHAYRGGAAYISMAIRAHELWNELEQETDTELLVQSGVLNMMHLETYPFSDGQNDHVTYKRPVEMLSAEEIRQRWPGLKLPDSFAGLFEPEAGYLYSEKCVAAYRRKALEAGAELLAHTPVEHIKVETEGVAVHTRSGVYYANQVILSAGAWFKTLEPFIRLPIRSIRKVVGWFEAQAQLFDAGRFPGFTLGGPEGGYYGFPSIGGAGLKIGRHDTGVEWKPGDAVAPFGHYKEDEGDLRNLLEAYMPQAAGRLVQGTVCKYEFSPDDNFIIDRHPEYPQVLLAGGFSGHGFKFSSVVGEMLSDLIIKGSTEQDIRMFSLSRFHNLV